MSDVDVVERGLVALNFGSMGREQSCDLASRLTRTWNKGVPGRISILLDQHLLPISVTRVRHIELGLEVSCLDNESLEMETQGKYPGLWRIGIKGIRI